MTGYCIRRGEDPPPAPGLAGVDGAEVRRVEAAGLALWLSEEAPGPPTVERVRAHDAVVRAALRTATPLPLRFGTRFAGEEGARELLRSRAAEFHAALDRVAGRVEMGIRVLWRYAPDEDAIPSVGEPGGDIPGAAPAPRSGREYLELRRAQFRREEAQRARDAALLDRLEAHFPGLPARRAPGSEPGVAGSVAHLVQRAELEPYRLLLHAARADLVEADLRLIGPWAPYSFV